MFLLLTSPYLARDDGAEFHLAKSADSFEIAKRSMSARTWMPAQLKLKWPSEAMAGIVCGRLTILTGLLSRRRAPPILKLKTVTHAQNLVRLFLLHSHHFQWSHGQGRTHKACLNPLASSSSSGRLMDHAAHAAWHCLFAASPIGPFPLGAEKLLGTCKATAEVSMFHKFGRPSLFQ